MKIDKIEITIHNFDSKDPMISIDSQNLSFNYSAPFHNMHGLQCEFYDETEKYKKLMKVCDEINDIIRRKLIPLF